MIADRWIAGTCEEVPLGYPMTTEVPFDHPDYISTLVSLL